jgi:hypothetical protein
VSAEGKQIIKRIFNVDAENRVTARSVIDIYVS